MTDEEILKKYNPAILSLMNRFRVQQGNWNDCYSECKVELFKMAREHDDEYLYSHITTLIMHTIVEFLTHDPQVHYPAYNYYRNKNNPNPIVNVSFDSMVLPNDDSHDPSDIRDILSFDYYNSHKPEFNKFDIIWDLIKKHLSKSEIKLIDLLFRGFTTHESFVHYKYYTNLMRKQGKTRTRNRVFGTILPNTADKIRKLAIKIFPKKKFAKMKQDKLVEAVRYQIQKRVVKLLNIHTNYMVETKHNMCDSYKPILIITGDFE